MNYMTLLRFLAIALFLLLFITTASAQSTSGVMNFFAARQYDDYEGEARIAKVRQLEKDNWYLVDSIYEWRDNGDNTPYSTTKRDLSPYVDESGEIVYWVTDIAPKFPDGRKGIQQYMREVVGTVVSGPDDETQNSIYIRCTIASDGSITDVAEAQLHPGWIPIEIIMQCLDAVRYMPAWSAGVSRGKAVRVCMLVEVALRE